MTVGIVFCGENQYDISRSHLQQLTSWIADIFTFDMTQTHERLVNDAVEMEGRQFLGGPIELVMSHLPVELVPCLFYSVFIKCAYAGVGPRSVDSRR